MMGLVPAVIQDDTTLKVLMLGFMNEEAYRATISSGRVTFYSRTKKRLWTKGEESGHFLEVTCITSDCDNDTLLIKARPTGPVCHTGTDTCWGESNHPDELLFLGQLQDLIDRRKKEMPEGSYTTSLFAAGIRKIAQKVGEEAVETVIGAMAGDDENLIYEGADLVYHLMVLLASKGFRIEDVVSELKRRHK
jgi:phosphoribosyl-ATP pyrophosphohydrolase/phosphoribosyl-AMP cyclohydrolase